MSYLVYWVLVILVAGIFIPADETSMFPYFVVRIGVGVLIIGYFIYKEFLE